MNRFPKNIKIKNLGALILLSFFILPIFGFVGELKEEPKPNLKSKQAIWVDSVLAGMSLDEKVGQLFMVATFSNRNELEYRKIEEQVRTLHLGGLIFFQGEPFQQAVLTNRYQSAAKIPLMIGIDGEWGLGMRLDNAISYPKAISLGAIQDNGLIEKMGEQIGKECKRLGVHINFAPDADINTNPKNPIINFRSFGENKYNVTSKALAYHRGMRKAGILACAKHFPGHGDTESDSHAVLPILEHDAKRLEDLELYPFRELIKDSIAGVMTGHLFVPAYETESNLPASVSKNIVTNLLRNTYGFTGLTFTDALNMRGLTRYYKNGNAELEAFKAGNDVLLQTGNLVAGIARIKEKILDSSIQISQLDNKVRRILKAKYLLGLQNYKPVDLKNIDQDLNTVDGLNLKKELFRNAITIVKNEQNLVPIVKNDTLKIGSVSISAKPENAFQNSLRAYGNFKEFTLPYKPNSATDWQWVADEASKLDLVIVSVHDMHNLASRNYGVTNSTIDLIKAISKNTKVIVCAFGNPYALRMFDEFDNLVCGYENEDAAFETLPEILFGKSPALGKLPISVSKAIKVESGISTAINLDEDMAKPESVGMNSQKLNEIEAIVKEGITANAYPGCQVLVARKGMIVYNKNFGNLRYGYNEPVTTETLYDLASLTKVSATLQAVMMLYDQGKLNLNQKASYYIPELRGTDKENIVIMDLLLHQAGLKAFVPFWTLTKSATGTYKPGFYEASKTPDNLMVSDKVFVKPSIRDSLLQWIIDSPFNSRVEKTPGHKFVYSDLGLILIQRVVENISKQSLDVYLETSLYKPLGMNNTLFNPLTRFPKSKIAPTENEAVFRNSQIQGTVHDPNAALLGGVAGHAGLFSTARDLFKLYQMNLDMGVFNGHKYFEPRVIELFSSKQSTKSHRGIGWNKPNPSEASSVGENAPDASYGHTGFTGTVVWVDPENELIFIMLANRVYPFAENNRLLNLKIRKRIHDKIYEAIE
jgi:beta-N-acetylhexosaminidase